MASSRAQIIKERLDLLASFSDRSDCLCREFGSNATMEVNALVVNWMKEAGLLSRVDNIGNVRGYSDNKKEQTFLMGSHLDTVLDAGKFDGPLGVLIAIDQAQHMNYDSFPYNFEVAGFSNEEGLRYSQCYLGSLTVAGGFKQEWLSSMDSNQVPLEQAIDAIGGKPSRLREDAIDARGLAGYLEVHIEQGPVLESLDLPVGVVSHISAQQRFLVTVTGVSGHAGTVPMEVRRDALAGAAALVLEVEKTANGYPLMVATVGKLEVNPGNTNVIPGRVTLTVDIRHPDHAVLNKAVAYLKQTATEIAQARQLVTSWENLFEEKEVTCDIELTKYLGKACEKAGYSLKQLPSGAGHDTIAISKIGPVCMLFVRCKDGISHNPLEEASLEDIEAAIYVCDKFFDSLHRIK